MLAVAYLVLAQAPAVQAPAAQAPTVPLIEGRGSYTRGVKSAHPLAPKYIDQGFGYMYGFQHDQAMRSFAEAGRLDPNLVMAHLGVAMALGNHINNPTVSADRSQRAIRALERARELRAKGSPVENDLVEAMFKRFDPKGPWDRKKLNADYADAMRIVFRKYPKDADVAVLYGESLLNQRPWEQWDLKGKAQPGTMEAIAAFNHALKLDRDHPQALHLLIHAWEGSKTSERALREANLLRDLQPGLYHMQHMPSHIYARTGRWNDAIRVNLQSISIYKRLGWQKDNTLDYAHARHMIAFCAAMNGQSDLAMMNVSQILDGLSPEAIKMYGNGAEYAKGMQFMFMVRFGKWKEILAHPEPPASAEYAHILFHESQGIAHAALKDPVKARASQAKFRELVAKMPKGPAGESDPILVATHLLEGEILIAEGKTDAGIAELRKAVEAEDSLPYYEPPQWIQPTRHTLGAALVEAGKYQEAVDVYQADLKNHPNNGWSLYGLHRAHTGLNQTRQAAKYLADYKKAWVDADFELTSSCLCLPGKG